MKASIVSHASLDQAGIQGILLVIAPVPLLFAWLHADAPFPHAWRIAAAAAAYLACITCSAVMFKRPPIGKLFGWLSLAGCFAAAFPLIKSNPFAALAALVGIIGAGYTLHDAFVMDHRKKRSRVTDIVLQRARWGAVALLAVVGLAMAAGETSVIVRQGVILTSTMTSQILFVFWSWRRYASKATVFLSCCSIFFLIILLLSLKTGLMWLWAVFGGVLTIFLLPAPRSTSERHGYWWDLLLSQPARILFTTFLSLCILGVLLLTIPTATTTGKIDLIDAAFTSVSAVCVTGLTVLDTPHDFTPIGQGFILLLIQLGGLGIMSIATVALHAIGRRISLRQERMLSTMTGAEQHDLIASLFTILKFTFVAESVGAVLLTAIFHSCGDPFGQAAWRGLFTAVSAFCNAGFALQSDSLAAYQKAPFVLHIVATLIIFGGIAPATSLLFPHWIAGRRIPVAPRIELVATATLLISGTIFMAAYEWNGALHGLSIFDKLHNAWFQSSTLRTAGFNSVKIANVAGPTFLVMICFMFVGGSPGGTAGGVKTTTISIVVLTFWANITRQNEVVIQNRRIPSAAIYRAITILASGACMWFAVVLMLEATQQIPARDIIFEATSAIGTVGLTTGATARLDEIGKIIVMIAMFAGRIGPMTLFMLLNEDTAVSASGCLDAKINVT